MRIRRVRRRGCAGFSLAETLIAVLLIAVVVSGVFSVSLSSQTMGAKTTERAMVQQEVLQAIERVKAYVNGGDRSAPGPNPGPQNQQWSIPGVVHDGGWALGIGRHNATGLLSPRLSDPPPAGLNARLFYTVQAGGDGGMRVDFEATWDD